MVPGATGWGTDDDPLVLHDGETTRELPVVSGDQRRFYLEVVAAIRGEGVSPVPAAQTLATMAVIDAGLRSSAERRAVPVALTEAERSAFRASLAA